VIFSAHGVSRAVRDEAARRGLKVFDATCPLVTKVHIEVARHGRAGRDVVLIGHAGHPEVEGTMGQWSASNGAGRIHLVETPECVAALNPQDPEKLAYVSQTTLSVDDTRAVIDTLRERFRPSSARARRHLLCHPEPPGCSARAWQQCDVVLVVGSPNSSNSNRLRELAERDGVEAHLIDGAEHIDPAWIIGKQRIGVTAGASAPELLVQGVLERLRELGASGLRELDGKPEDVVFALPKELRVVLVN
jgi:4-hydroxy-3-methylbut-2-enyl diphosphate reductase